MNKDVLWGLVVAVAFVGALFLHEHHKHAISPPAPVSAPVETGEINAVSPAPAPVIVPWPDHQVATQCTLAKPCHTVKIVGTKQKPVYEKVMKGGKVDGTVKCKQVPAVAKEFTKQQVMDAAASYGLSPAQLAELSVCLN